MEAPVRTLRTILHSGHHTRTLHGFYRAGLNDSTFIEFTVESVKCLYSHPNNSQDLMSDLHISKPND